MGVCLGPTTLEGSVLLTFAPFCLYRRTATVRKGRDNLRSPASFFRNSISRF